MSVLAAVPAPERFQTISQALRGCCADGLCERHKRDELYGWKSMKECWSMLKSVTFHGDLPVMSAHTKEIVQHEALLHVAREKELSKFRSLETRLEEC